MNSDTAKLRFESDYMEGALPQILANLLEVNLVHSTGYGLDDFSEAAKKKIRIACNAPEADIYFLAGGTQTNATVIDAVLKPWQGVMSAASGHISVHEAGAVEMLGHKIINIPSSQGKISAEGILDCCKTFEEDDNRDHMVMPGMVYISHPTEYGTLYSLDELTQISAVCRRYNVPLYMDGARLAYALACPENDVTLEDIARLCDVFYIGGTKCGALFSEAVVIPKHDFIPHFFTLIKQHGALLAKGFIAGIQFDTLFTDDLYTKAGENAIKAADKIREALIQKGYTLSFESPTNQIFITLDNEQTEKISESAVLSFMEKTDDGRNIMRITTGWATSPADVDRLIEIL